MDGRRPPDDWLAFVEGFVAMVEAGRRLAPPAAGPRPAAVGNGSGPRVVISAPHPDDESLTGGLALRLRQEAGAAVTVIAMTFGSASSRRQARRRELAAACALLGFDWQPGREPWGFGEALRRYRHRRDPAWEQAVAQLTDLFDRLLPALVIAPHAGDRHPTHIGCHHLVVAALKEYARHRPEAVLLAETEFWQPLASPNLLAGLAPADVARLAAAVACHQGEVARHPYHLLLPPRLMETARRGSERLAGWGRQPPAIWFGDLYRVRQVKEGRLLGRRRQRLVVVPEEPLAMADLATLL